jgi:hypothetical protein
MWGGAWVSRFSLYCSFDSAVSLKLLCLKRALKRKMRHKGIREYFKLNENKSVTSKFVCYG